MIAMQETMTELREGWKRDGAGSDLGLWWLANDVRDTVGEGHSRDEVRNLTLEAVHPLLESGDLRAGDLKPDGTFAPWQGTVEEILNRISREWKALGRDPDIGDIVWFAGER